MSLKYTQKSYIQYYHEGHAQVWGRGDISDSKHSSVIMGRNIHIFWKNMWFENYIFQKIN